MALARVEKQTNNIVPIGKQCRVCNEFSGKLMYCSNAHKQKAYRQRRKNKLQAVTSNQEHVTSNALLAAQLETNELLKQLLANGISTTTTQTGQNAHHATPELTLNDLSELQSKRAKTNGQSRQNLLNAMSSMAGTKKITIKSEPKNNVIAGSEIDLPEPTFEGLEL